MRKERIKKEKEREGKKREIRRKDKKREGKKREIRRKDKEKKEKKEKEEKGKISSKVKSYLPCALKTGFFLTTALLLMAILSRKTNFFSETELSKLITIAAARMKIQPVIIPL